MAICLDGTKSFRKEASPTYKSTRRPVDISLIDQFPIIREAIKVFDICSPSYDGYEADDIIATYAKIASQNGHNVTIISPDKDLLQIIDDNIVVVNSTGKKPIDINDFRRLYDIEPYQFPHLQSLIGDKIDNIPKVAGLSEEKAKKLIKQYGTIHRIIEHIDEIEDTKVRNAIKNNIDQIKESFHLAELKSDLKVPPLETLEFKSKFEKDKILGFLRKYKFNSIEKYMFTHYWSHEIETTFEIDYSQHPMTNEYNSINNPELKGVPLKKKHLDPDELYKQALAKAREKNPHYLDFDPGDSGLTELNTDQVVEEVLDYENEKGTKNIIKLISSRVIEVDPELVDAFTLATNPKERREALEKKIKGVTIVNDEESAKRVLEKLMTLKDRYHACDTECIGIDIKNQSPVGYGTVICASIYCGPDVDFGNGSRIWIDNLGDSEGTLNLFKEYFESEEILKVWHNYGFDRHVLYNHGIDAKGFGGDTMHMARLWDVSHGMRGYSLASLSSLLLNENAAKKSMKLRFGSVKLKKDGTPSKSTIVYPELDQLQRDPKWIAEWIDYSTLDAESTWLLREELEKRLDQMKWDETRTMKDFYHLYWRPFGEILTDMERRGIRVDVEYLESIIPIAQKEKEEYEKKFIDWAVKYVSPECRFMNPGSDAQKQQILFAPCRNALNPSKSLEATRTFECDNVDGYIEEGKKAPKKKRKFVLPGLGLPFVDTTVSGWPSVSQDVLTKLAGNPPHSYGPLVEMFEAKGLEGGKEACEAISAVVNASKIDTLINTFMIPLKESADKNGRIHGSININTETGRLSSRRPNLQNQPSVEKDRFKIRKAFTADPGKILIVADYGQLELRLLAHITKCKSMIEAFAQGGDFHSRTALGMYPEIQEAIKNKEILLEWDYSKGEPPLPLLKDAYAVHRRRAKTLNFSIAYGKTVRGLAKDWNVSTKEAQETLDRWFSDRPEVLQWQQKTIAEAHRTGYTRTLLGRYRHLPHINSKDITQRAHSERAAINTPLQGGAADITTLAMIKIYRDERLNKLGWHQLLQIHDELILEGPEESVEEAKQIVVDLMSNPLPEPLLVNLVVDAKIAKNWYDGK